MYFSVSNKKHKQKGDIPMRKIIEVQPSFSFNLTCDRKVIAEYRRKYEKIDIVLDENPDILSTFHQDLRRYGSASGKDSDYSSEQVLRMIMVKCIEQLSYRDTIIRVAESDFLRNFTRLGISRVMGYAFLCEAAKCIGPSTWEKINDILLRIAHADNKISGESLRIDSTVSETNIHYPTDNSLLWDCYRVLARTIRHCNEAEPMYNCGNRFHEKKIKRLYTFIATHSGRSNKRTKRKIARTFRVMIDRVDRLCDTTHRYSANARAVRTFNPVAEGLMRELERVLPLARQVVEQSYRARVQDETVPACERIFSIFEEHTELLKRGKSRSPVEFGHLVTLGQTREKFISFYDVQEVSPHDVEMKDIALEDHKEKFGSYPQHFTADKNYYRSMSDIEQWEERMSTCAIGKKGRRTRQEYDREHSESFKFLQRFRAGIEGSISVLKRAFGLRRCLNRGFKSFAAAVGCLVFCHNLVLLSFM